ncbi:hypothetical protein E5A44_06670 [Salmonella enterica subsp. enterica serovar Lubbock]|uniref:Secreted protein n=4 Tax=Salmonella enterica TaxID=28901 RepID=A0A5Y4IKZ3_SALER|nr:hypothetical protein CHC43_23260 [Salmonella enterica subsp. enterica serovar Mbandaka]AYJ62167.1 hypothetical protein D8S90_03010 [Salmonella enterica subsp. enterica serovar Lubbock]EAA0457756.1 hypothetical protein [Salmonella enterica]EAA5786008.1 hypothetical protein [Salmonella enterica subsp. enterica]EBE7962133.1 hypothetical protein [Salmonella enterica subsp. enterica serovar Infantis]EBV6442903.1 hypothetical protein [Salmonella enterica subsp. enterica serovar Havana]EBW0158978
MNNDIERLGVKGNLLIFCSLLLSFSANAGRITMRNPEQTTTENSRTLCVYSNSIYTFTYITKSKHCPYSRTFDTVDRE